MGLGAMRERLTLQTTAPAALSVQALTRSGATATVTTVAAHGYATGDVVRIAGAAQSAYNVRAQIAVTGARTCTYTVSGTPTTPATGTITVTYLTDGQGGRRQTWRTIETVSAELVPLRAGERLQIQAMQSETAYRFRIRMRADLTAAMRALWTPQWPHGSAEQTLEIAGIIPEADGRTYLLVDCRHAPIAA